MQLVPSLQTTTLTAAINGTVTSIPVASAANIIVGCNVKIDTELLNVTGISGNSLTVTRNYLNPPPGVAHTNGATVTILPVIRIGPLVSASTQLPITGAVPFTAIYIDQKTLDPLGVFGNAIGTLSTGGLTGTPGSGIVGLISSPGEGYHKVDVCVSGALPWSDDYFLGPLPVKDPPYSFPGNPAGIAALLQDGLMMLTPGAITAIIGNPEIATNLPWNTTNKSILMGQLLTFTSGVLASQSFAVIGYSQNQNNSYVRLMLNNSWENAPAVGDTFVLSNVNTASNMTTAISGLPTLNQLLRQDGFMGCDGGPIMSLNGQIMGTLNAPPIVQGSVASTSSSTNIEFGSVFPVNSWVYVWPQATGLPQWTQVTGLDTGSGSTVSPAVPSVAAGDAWWAPTVPMVALAASQPNYAPATNTPPTMSPEGFTRLWALTPAAQGVALDCIGTINGAGNYTNAANTLPLAWNEGGNGCWGIAIDYEVGNWLGPTTPNSPLGVYTSAGQPNITVVAADPTSQIVRDAMTQATAATPADGSIDAQLGSLAAAINIAPIVVRRLIDPSGALEINSGCDYPDSSGRSIQFGVPSGFADLTGSTPTLDITLVVGGLPASKPVLTITGQILTGSYTINGKTYTTILDFQPTAAQTASLTNWSPNAYVYRVRAVWTSPAKTLPVVDESPCTALW